MRIIGHRGAAGLALENTLESIRAGIKAGVDAVEFDVRLTADGQFVLCHDRDTGKISGHDLIIHESSLSDLMTLTLHNGERIATLDEAIDAAGAVPVVIEAKGSRWAPQLAAALADIEADITVIAFNHRELLQFHELAPQIPVFALERTRAFEVIQYARAEGLSGVDLSFWLLNPLTYWLAKRSKLQIIVYTVNSRWIAQFLRMLFPGIWLTTDLPHHFQFMRDHLKRTKKPKIKH